MLVAKVVIRSVAMKKFRIMGRSLFVTGSMGMKQPWGIHELLMPVSTPNRVYWLHIRGVASSTPERLPLHSIGLSVIPKQAYEHPKVCCDNKVMPRPALAVRDRINIDLTAQLDGPAVTVTVTKQEHVI